MHFLRGGFGIELFVNGFLPWLVYSLAQPEMGRVHALMASAIPPIIWSAIELVRNRRLDALSILVLAGIGLSLAAFFGGGGYRMLQLREHLAPGVIALAFLGSVAIKRPLLVVIARAAVKRRSPEDAEKFEREIANERVRRLLTRLNLGIGFLLLLQVVIAVILVFALPIREFLIVSPIINYTIAGLFLGAMLYMKPKLVAALKAAKQDRNESTA